MTPKAKILICGPIAEIDFGFEGITGADAIATDFDSALVQMEMMVKSEQA